MKWVGIWKGVAAISLFASAGAADAADIETPAPYDWSGFYVGVDAGVASAHYDGIYDSSDLDEIPPDSHIPASALDGNGIFGGIHAGWNYQAAEFVVGLEADIALLNISENAFEPEDASEETTAELDSLSSLRARAGFAMDNVLFYGTAGVAYAVGDYRIVDDDEKGSVSLDQVGLAVGGGVEWGATENISLRAEGLYYAFNGREDTSDLTSDADPDDFIELNDIFVARLGASFRF